jgi:hypothetical protein
MTIELLSPLIALAGVIISILVSAFVSARQSKLEIKKLRTELQMSYASKLVDKRMETYPVLFKLISEFEKVSKYGSLQKPMADKLLREILQWDSSHSLFMGSYAIRKYTWFRKFIFSLTKMSKKEFEIYVSQDENKKVIVRQIRDLEFALKQDLGVFVVDFPDMDKNLSSNSEVSDLVYKQLKRNTVVPVNPAESQPKN